MSTFVARPDGEGPFPVVFIYMDAPGIREELRDFARRVARQGYYCALPDLYYRRGRVRYDLQKMDEAMRAEMFGHMRSLNNGLVMRDTDALLHAVADDPAAADGPKGCIGYCMSGQYVVSAAGTYPEHFAAAVSCYGVGIVTGESDSPHLLAPSVTGELFLAFAERDEYVPDSAIETLRKTLAEQDVAHRIEIYPGTEHGFCFPERTPVYAEAAAEDVWTRTFSLFARRLQS
jgi:carboxymethylenebutenolidase